MALVTVWDLPAKDGVLLLHQDYHNIARLQTRLLVTLATENDLLALGHSWNTTGCII